MSAEACEQGVSVAPNERFPARPFLKWPGGKRWVASLVVAELSQHLSGRYYEPFVGGGAVFFNLRPATATLSDINGELINVYRQVRDNHREVVESLQMLVVSKEMYLAVRAWRPRSQTERAARFLYLNRTAFGGMYRLNRAGEFNVPYGGGQRTPRILWESRLVENAATALTGVSLRSCDFGSVMSRARAGDVVYCDPTYTVSHQNNGFVRYNERNFSWSDQIRLASAARAARARGALVLVSNAYHRSIRELYFDAAAQVLERKSRISVDSKHRRLVREYLFALKP